MIRNWKDSNSRSTSRPTSLGDMVPARVRAEQLKGDVPLGSPRADTLEAEKLPPVAREAMVPLVQSLGGRVLGWTWENGTHERGRGLLGLAQGGWVTTRLIHVDELYE